jgi:GNAT superfamily N-acetyltransferase
MGDRPVIADGNRLMPAQGLAATPLAVTDAAGERAEAVIRDGLSAYNLEKAGYRDHWPLAVLVSDPDTGDVVGGLLGRTSMGLLYIDRFFLPERLRKQGLGSRIIRAAEEEGARRGCSWAILSTLSFQAPGFYERQGWQVLGRIDCDPPGHTRFMMTKKLARQ